MSLPQTVFSPSEGNTTSSSAYGSSFENQQNNNLLIMAMMGQQLQQQQAQQNNNNSHGNHRHSDSDGGGSSDDDSDHSAITPKRKRTSQVVDKNLKEKNKEHARNTRLRKKNFIDHLKQAIQDLGRERDEDEIRLRSELTRIAAGVSEFFLQLLLLTSPSPSDGIKKTSSPVIFFLSSLRGNKSRKVVHDLV
jgi:hypothetical protein